MSGFVVTLLLINPVLDGGRITERGTHDELMSLNGEYARLCTLQASGYTSTTHD